MCSTSRGGVGYIEIGARQDSARVLVEMSSSIFAQGNIVEAEPAIEGLILWHLSERRESYTSQPIAACVFNSRLH